MNIPEERLNDELRKRLRQKFDGFQAPVKKSVYTYVFAALGANDGSRFRIAMMAGSLAVLTVFVLAGYFGLTRKEHILNSVALKNIQESGQSKRERKAKKSLNFKEYRITEPVPERKVQDDKLNFSGIKYETKKQATYLKKQDTADTLEHNRKGNAKVLVASNEVINLDKLYNVSNSDRRLEELSLEDKIGLGSASQIIKNSQEIKPVPMKSRSVNRVESKFTFPAVIASAAPPVAGSKSNVHNKLIWVFSGAVLQTFQVINLNSNIGDGFQNIGFAPALSSKSLGYKFSAGFESNRFRLLVTYGRLRNWNTYEIATNKIDVEKSGANLYHFSRVGDRYLQDEHLHLAGLSIKRELPLPVAFFRNYRSYIGLEYNRVLPTRQNLIWGNLNMAKRIFTSERASFEIGPYLEYSFSKRSVEKESWKSRPYRVGISLDIKIK